jgi:hypothetical protein
MTDMTWGEALGTDEGPAFYQPPDDPPQTEDEADHAAYRAWLRTVDQTPDANVARATDQMARAHAIHEANPAVPFITCLTMAGDAQSAEAATSMLDAGVSFVHATIHVGSYSRIRWMLDMARAGRVPEATVWDALPAWWPHSDPDDTDPDMLRLWEDAWAANGHRTILDDPDKPLPPGRRLVVYRGQGRDDRAGIAWSLSEDVARKFANGASVRVPGGIPNPVVYTARIHRRMVMAYLTTRREQEVIINPAFLR